MDFIEEELLPNEKSFGFSMLTSVTIMIHFDDEVSSDFLLKRMLQTMVNNPFLAGRLIRNTSRQVALRFPSPQSLTSCITQENLAVTHFKVIDHISSPFDSLCYGQMVEYVKDRAVKRGRCCIDKDEPLFLLTLYRYGDGYDQNQEGTLGTRKGRSSLLVSMSHVIGDGFTFFRIVDALGASPLSNESKAPSRVMDCTRDKSFRASLAQIVGEASLRFQWHWTSITGKLLNLLINPKRTCALFQLSSSFINQEKRASTGMCEYVTTNDVLVSSLASPTLFDCDFINLVVHLRPFLFPTHQNPTQDNIIEKAGNYFAAVVLNRAAMTSPANVRAAVQSRLKRATKTGDVNNSIEEQDDDFPSLYERFRLYGTMLVSNWCSLESPSLQLPAVNGQSGESPEERLLTMTRMMPLMFQDPGACHVAIIFPLCDKPVTKDSSSSNSHSNTQNKVLGLAVLTHPQHISRLARHPLVEKQLYV